MNITLTNTNPVKNIETSIELDGIDKIKSIAGEIITADQMNAYNDFGKKEEVNIKKFDDFKITKNEILTTLPSKSVVLLTVEQKP